MTTLAPPIRRSPGARRPRRSEKPDPMKVTIGGAIVMALLVGVIYLGVRLVNGVPAAGYTTMFIEVPEVGNLLLHDPVRVAGVRVGQVVGRGVAPNGQARIQLQLDPSLKLHTGTAVALRANGLLGARYVQLIPGHGRATLPAGSTIHGGPDSFTFGLPQALDTFNAQTRGGLGATLNGLGEGFLGHGTNLNGALHAANGAVVPFRTFALAVLSHDGAAARLVPALDAAVTPLDANRANLSHLMQVTGDALQPFVSERVAVRATIAGAPAALAATTANVPAGLALVDSLRSVSGALARTLPAAPVGLTNLSQLLATSRLPMQRATALLRTVPAAVPGALRITGALAPVLPKLLRMVGLSTPTLDTVARYGCDVENFGVTMRSMTGFTQPGADGPAGPPQAFRLQAIIPLGGDALSIKNTTSELARDAVSPPCEYGPSTYSQLVPKLP
jgi:ABC-type transporter Mla subunit MlaD